MEGRQKALVGDQINPFKTTLKERKRNLFTQGPNSAPQRNQGCPCVAGPVTISKCWSTPISQN